MSFPSSVTVIVLDDRVWKKKPASFAAFARACSSGLVAFHTGSSGSERSGMTV